MRLDFSWSFGIHVESWIDKVRESCLQGFRQRTTRPGQTRPAEGQTRHVHLTR